MTDQAKAFIIGATISIFAVVICVSLIVKEAIDACSKRTGGPCHLELYVGQARP